MTKKDEFNDKISQDIKFRIPAQRMIFFVPSFSVTNPTGKDTPNLPISLLAVIRKYCIDVKLASPSMA